MRGHLLALFAFALALGCPMGAQAIAPPVGFPPSLYPAPRYFPPWGDGSGCPSLSGVQVPGPGAANAAFPTVARFGRVSLQVDLHSSDRAIWSGIRHSWLHKSRRFRQHGLLPRSDIVGVHPARHSPYAALIRHNCGAATMAHSLEFVVCGRLCYPALRFYIDLIERRGHWLIWFTY